MTPGTNEVQHDGASLRLLRRTSTVILTAMLAAMLGLPIPPAAGAATLTLADGTTVTGDLSGVLVQRQTMSVALPGKAMQIRQHLYILTRGSRVISAGGDGVRREGSPAAVAVVTADETMKVIREGGRTEWGDERTPVDDGEILSRFFAGRATLGLDSAIVNDHAVLLVPRPSEGEVVDALTVVGSLREDAGSIRFAPELSVVAGGNERKIPVSRLAVPDTELLRPRDGVMKARASGSAQGPYRMTAVELENTMRPSIPDRFATGDQHPALERPCRGVIWHVRCDLESKDGIGIDLPTTLAKVNLVDERGREIVPIQHLSAGFRSDVPNDRGGYMEFLALGPPDSRVVTVRYGDGAITVPME